MRMTLLAILVPVLSQAATVQHMSWDKPGANRYTGMVSAAIDNYQSHLTADQRDAIKRKVATNDYDDIIEIRRHTITGKSLTYSPDLTHMHFGVNTVAVNVSRARWRDDEVQMARVFRVTGTGTCVVIPAVCTNVALVECSPKPRPEPEPAPDGGTPGGTGGGLRFHGWLVPQLPAAPSIVPSPIDPLPAPVPAEPEEAVRWMPPMIELPPPMLPAPSNPIPEPASWSLAIAGLIALALMRKKYV